MDNKESNVSVNIIDSEDEYKVWMIYAQSDYELGDRGNQCPKKIRD